jgi:hypothetical protein
MKDNKLRTKVKRKYANSEHKKNFRKRHPEKYECEKAFTNAIAIGKIKRQACEICGSEKSEGHHRDYSRPLDVTWLCKKHHVEEHKKLPRAPNHLVEKQKKVPRAPKIDVIRTRQMKSVIKIRKRKYGRPMVPFFTGLNPQPKITVASIILSDLEP